MKKFLIPTFLLMTASTWASAVTPSRAHVLAAAIAKAEGFFVKGSLPNRLHNPGDMRALGGERYPGQVGLNKRGYIIFKNDAAGWAALYRQIDKIVSGESKHYTVNMSLRQLAKKYANSPTWVKNVSSFMDVKPDTRLWDVLDLPPVLK